MFKVRHWDWSCHAAMFVCSVRQVKTSWFAGEEMKTALRSSSILLTYTAASAARRSTPTSSQSSTIEANCMLRNCDWLAIWRESASATATPSDCFACWEATCCPYTSAFWVLQWRLQGRPTIHCAPPWPHPVPVTKTLLSRCGTKRVELFVCNKVSHIS